MSRNAPIASTGSPGDDDLTFQPGRAQHLNVFLQPHYPFDQRDIRLRDLVLIDEHRAVYELSHLKHSIQSLLVQEHCRAARTSGQRNHSELDALLFPKERSPIRSRGIVRLHQAAHASTKPLDPHTQGLKTIERELRSLLDLLHERLAPDRHNPRGADSRRRARLGLIRKHCRLAKEFAWMHLVIKNRGAYFD